MTYNEIIGQKVWQEIESIGKWKVHMVEQLVKTRRRSRESFNWSEHDWHYILIICNFEKEVFYKLRNFKNERK